MQLSNRELKIHQRPQTLYSLPILHVLAEHLVFYSVITKKISATTDIKSGFYAPRVCACIFLWVYMSKTLNNARASEIDLNGGRHTLWYIICSNVNCAEHGCRDVFILSLTEKNDKRYSD